MDLWPASTCCHTSIGAMGSCTVSFWQALQHWIGLIRTLCRGAPPNSNGKGTAWALCIAWANERSGATDTDPQWNAGYEEPHQCPSCQCHCPFSCWVPAGTGCGPIGWKWWAIPLSLAIAFCPAFDDSKVTWNPTDTVSIRVFLN